MNGCHVKKSRDNVMIARIETKMYTQNHHEIVKAVAFDEKLYWGKLGV